MAQPTKVWNKNFALLWQGQLVSQMGDMVFEIALGFWVLARTGSTGLMGSIMAASMIPRFLLSPFAGVLVDRMDRKWVLVWMDLLRGVLVVVGAILAFTNHLEIWMIFLAGVIIGICASFFDTAVPSSIPDIVPKKGLIKANSALGMIHTLAGIFGNSLGGVLYALVGAPMLFLFNGISYLFSSFTELFISIPKVKHTNEEFLFLRDFKDGIRFLFGNPGLRILAFNAMLLNFILSMGGVLYLPYFQRSDQWGAVQFGVAMAILTGGAFVGMAALSILKIPPTRRHRVFILMGVLFAVCRTLVLAWPSLPAIYVFMALMGLGVAVVNAIIGAAMQLIVPADKRAKVFGATGSLSMGFAPVGMAVGGWLAEFISIPTIVMVTGFAALLGFLPAFFSKDLRDYNNFEPEEEEDASAGESGERTSLDSAAVIDERD